MIDGAYKETFHFSEEDLRNLLGELEIGRQEYSRMSVLASVDQDSRAILKMRAYTCDRLYRKFASIMSREGVEYGEKDRREDEQRHCLRFD